MRNRATLDEAVNSRQVFNLMHGLLKILTLIFLLLLDSKLSEFNSGKPVASTSENTADAGKLAIQNFKTFS